MIKKMERFSKWPALLWTGLIFILLIIPSEGIPNSGMLGLPYLDKLAHLILFGMFVWLWSLNTRETHDGSGRQRSHFLLFLISSGYGILMEFVQAGFTNRAFEKLDIVADMTGAGLAWIFLHLSHRQKK
jgi:VanZ family protein